MQKFSVSPLASAVSAVLLSSLLATPAAFAHTVSVGYENAGAGSVTFWYGTYHTGVTYTEGSLQVTGPNSYSATVPFSLLATTKPTGLIDGTTNFYSDGSTLVGTYGGTLYAWQGSTFTSLSAGSYTFTYVPISTPTSVWAPGDSVILSSTVTLDATVIGTPDPLFVEQSTSISRSTASVLDSLNGESTGGMTAAIGVLSSLSPAEQSAALNRIAPVTSNAYSTMASTNLSGSLDTVQLRLDRIRTEDLESAWVQDLKAGKVKVAAIGDLGGLFNAETKRRAVWTKAFASRNDQDMDAGYAGYNAKTHGIAIGADTLVSDAGIIGAAVSYANTDLDLEDFRVGDGSEINSYQLTGYGTRNFGPCYLEGMVAYARHQYENARNTGIAGIANADFDASQYGARVTAGYPITIRDTVTVTPLAGIETDHLKQDGYTEQSGGALALHVEEQSATRLRSVIGVKLATALTLHNGVTVTPSLHAAWRHEFKDQGVDTTATFTGGGAAFTTPGQDLARNRYNIGAEVSFQQTERFSLSVQLDGDWASGYSAASGQVVGQWRF